MKNILLILVAALLAVLSWVLLVPLAATVMVALVLHLLRAINDAFHNVTNDCSDLMVATARGLLARASPPPRSEKPRA